MPCPSSQPAGKAHVCATTANSRVVNPSGLSEGVYVCVRARARMYACYSMAAFLLVVRLAPAPARPPPADHDTHHSNHHHTHTHTISRRLSK